MYSDSKLLGRNIRNRVILSVGALLTLVGISGYFFVQDSQHRLIEHQAATVAEIITRQATASRTIYSKNIREKAPHPSNELLPLPAEFLRTVALEASSNSAGLYEYRAVSKWNLSTEQNLNNEFLVTAWKNLERQDRSSPDKAIDWKPFYQIQEVEGKDTLMYLKADPAITESCIACHNAYEKKPEIIERRIQQGIKPGKQWQQHQLMGAIYAQIPIESVRSMAFKEGKQTIAWIIATLTGGLILLAFFLLEDIVQAKEVTKQLFWQAWHDELTNLPNRRKFEKETQDLILDAKTNSGTHTVCFLDLDRFKLVNDTCGHAAGDELLCNIADILQSNLCDSDLLARLGGDEFGVLLRNKSIDEAIKISEELCRVIKDFEFLKGRHTFNIGVSIGLVSIDKHTKDVESVLGCADLACYSAKESGRNTVKVYYDNDKKMRLRTGEISWLPRILHAFEERRFVLYYQKISSISEGDPHSHYEILLRLIDDQGNAIGPDRFLPTAVRYDLMNKIDLEVIRQTFAALKHKQFADLSDGCFVSINLSGQSLSNAHFLVTVKNLMDEYKIDPRQVCFEITESVAIDNLALVQKFITEMKARGVSFALDDFGTGLSSLSYLKQFSVDLLKIDGRFVRDIVDDSIDRTLVTAISQMAHTMGMRTVAEYVESKEILDLLREMNIDYAQGYYINKPTAVEC